MKSESSEEDKIKEVEAINEKPTESLILI